MAPPCRYDTNGIEDGSFCDLANVIRQRAILDRGAPISEPLSNEGTTQNELPSKRHPERSFCTGEPNSRQ